MVPAAARLPEDPMPCPLARSTALASLPCLAALLLAHPAAAQEPLPVPPAPAPGPSSTATTTAPPPVDRDALMEVNLRYRYMSVPDAIIDIWFFDEDDAGANPYARPGVRMYALGVEYVLKPRPSNWIFYYEYIGSSMEEGYWDDVEEPAQHDDGDWIQPDRLGMHALGFNYAHEVDATDPTRDVWLSFLFGAGLGAGLVTGDMVTWHPGGNDNVTSGCRLEDPSYLRKDTCPADDRKRIPRVLPIVDLTASARLNFADRANVRLDLGLHDVLYVGTAVGGVF
jgi:hypothetical protein